MLVGNKINNVSSHESAGEIAESSSLHHDAVSPRHKRNNTEARGKQLSASGPRELAWASQSERIPTRAGPFDQLVDIQSPTDAAKIVHRYGRDDLG